MKSIRCVFGFHKWVPVGEIEVEWVNKWESYEHAEGKCLRCTATANDINRRY